jgi:hypothetical protein
MIRILNFLSYISYIYIISYGCLSILLDPSNITLKIKIITSLLLVVSALILIVKKELDKKKEEQLREEEYFDRKEIKSGVNSLSNQQRIQEMEKRENLKTTKDYLRYGMMQIDDINHNLRIISRNLSIYHNFRLLYLEQIKKIPQFYDQNEWVESESEIYHSLEKKIKNHYESRGLSASGFPKEQLELLKKKREKLLIAKRREFANKK